MASARGRAAGRGARAARDDPRAGLSRAEYAYVRLRGEIRDGELKAGQRLRETELAARLGISRTPVREAIRRLAADRLIENLPGRGLAVAALDLRRVRDLYFLRAVLEGAAAELAARHASESEIVALRDLLERMRARVGDPAATARLNRRFHRAIYDAARNDLLARALEPMFDFVALLPGTTFAAADRAERALAEHAEIVEAIARRSAEDAERAARAHIRRAGETRMRMMFEVD